MRGAAAALGTLGTAMVVLVVAGSLAGSAMVSTGPAWADSGSGTAVTPPSAPDASSPAVAATAGDVADTTATADNAEQAGATPPPVAVSPPAVATPPGTVEPTAASSAPAAENPWAGPALAPAPATRLRIPSIAVDAGVLPVDSTPTGERNAWGGEIFGTIDFPVDDRVRQWVRRGDPNSVPPIRAQNDVKAFDRVILYGHASDIGHHLVFQDLSSMRPGDAIIVDTELGTFTYRAQTVLTREKTDLDSLPDLYAYPKNGAKEIALVACLPDTSSNVVVLGVLTAVTGSTDDGTETAAP